MSWNGTNSNKHKPFDIKHPQGAQELVLLDFFGICSWTFKFCLQRSELRFKRLNTEQKIPRRCYLFHLLGGIGLPKVQEWHLFAQLCSKETGSVVNSRTLHHAPGLRIEADLAPQGRCHKQKARTCADPAVTHRPPGNRRVSHSRGWVNTQSKPCPRAGSPMVSTFPRRIQPWVSCPECEKDEEHVVCFEAAQEINS